MELYLLRAFVAVAETGHMTRAAERLHVSQPAVSAQIKALEEDFGVRLFDRGPGGMTLTRAAKPLLEQAERTLAAAEELRRMARSLRGTVAGKLKIGTASEPEFIRLGEFLGKTVERYPSIELELHAEISGIALESVRDGLLDASFYLGDLVFPTVTGMKLLELTFCVAAPAAWGERVRSAGWGEIAAMPWVLMPAVSTHSHLVHALFREHRVEPAQVVVADQESVVANLVTSGVGVSLLRESMALDLQRGGEVVIWEQARLKTTLWFVYLSERAHDPLIEALLEVLAQTWQPESPRLELSPRRRPRRSREPRPA